MSTIAGPGQPFTVTIEKLTHGGAGLTHIEGIPVFVTDSIPGQQVEIVITKNKESYREAKVVKVVRKAKDEIMPRCSHFHDCGGCVWQNLPYDKQIDYKEDIVRETLEHLTPVDESVRKSLPGRVLKIIPSPQVYHYRNKLEMSFGFQSMRVEEKAGRRIYFDENPTIGFHQPGQWSTVLPIVECHLYDEQIGMLLGSVRKFMEQTRLPVYNPKTQKGMLRTLLLRRGVQTGEQMICFLVHARKKELEPLFQHFMTHFGGRSQLASLLVVEHLGLNDKPEHPKLFPLIGKPTITERLFDLSFEISPFSFFQTNTLGAEKLYRAIAEAAAEFTDRFPHCFSHLRQLAGAEQNQDHNQQYSQLRQSNMSHFYLLIGVSLQTSCAPSGSPPENPPARAAAGWNTAPRAEPAGQKASPRKVSQ